MMDASEAVIWVNDETKQIMIWPHRAGVPDRLDWSDPIGAAYVEWRKMKTPQRTGLMVETAIDLAMQGYDLGYVLRSFAEVKEFRALGAKSYPMCRALTSALVGQCLEANTMTFEELLVAYRPAVTDGDASDAFSG
jgi:hypothetical protein